MKIWKTAIGILYWYFILVFGLKTIGTNGFATVFGPATIDADGFEVGQPLDTMVTIHRYGLVGYESVSWFSPAG